MLGKTLSLSPGWGAASPGPPPRAPLLRAGGDGCGHEAPGSSTGSGLKSHHLVSALTPQLHSAARGWVPFLQMLRKV